MPRNPDKPRKPVVQTRCGKDDRKVTGEAAVPYGFAEVHRACHRFLMERDPIYRKQRLARESGDTSASKPFAGF